MKNQANAQHEFEEGFSWPFLLMLFVVFFVELYADGHGLFVWELF